MSKKRKTKYATEAQRKKAMKAYQKAYNKAKRDGTWISKKSLSPGERVIRMTSKGKPEPDPMVIEVKRLRKERRAKILAEREARRLEREKEHQQLLEKYGCEVWSASSIDANNPEQVEARKAYLRDQDAVYRDQHRAHITEYNREYRRRKRAEALEKAQPAWTAEEWSAWRAKEMRKRYGSSNELVKSVVKILAEEQNANEDVVLEKLFEYGGVEFLTRGATAFGKALPPAMIRAAARAVMFMMDPEHAVMFPTEPWKRSRRQPAQVDVVS